MAGRDVSLNRGDVAQTLSGNASQIPSRPAPSGTRRNRSMASSIVPSHCHSNSGDGVSSNTVLSMSRSVSFRPPGSTGSWWTGKSWSPQIRSNSTFRSQVQRVPRLGECAPKSISASVVMHSPKSLQRDLGVSPPAEVRLAGAEVVNDHVAVDDAVGPDVLGRDALELRPDLSARPRVFSRQQQGSEEEKPERYERREESPAAK